MSGIAQIAPETVDDRPIFWQPQPVQREALLRTENEIYFGGAKSGGKLQPIDSKVVTPKGLVEIGALEIGDIVSDPTTGGTTEVIGVFDHPPMPIYRLTFDDGASIEVGGEHLWAYRFTGHKKPGTKPSLQRDYAAEELGAEPCNTKWDAYHIGDTNEIIRHLQRGKKIRFPLTSPVVFTKYWREHSECEPYLLGLLLGDGNLHGAAITNIDPEIIDYLHERGYRTSPGDPKDHRATGEHRRTLRHWLYMHGLLSLRSWEKFIPEPLLYAPVGERLELLRGLLDTDGTVDDKGQASFCSTSRRLAEDVQFLARSLGAKAYIRVRRTKYKYNGETRDGRESYNVEIRHAKPSALFKLSRKRAKCYDTTKGVHEITRRLDKAEYVGDKPARCIKVSSPRGLYLAENFIVTHNTDCQIMWTARMAVARENGKLKYPNYRAFVVRTEAEYLKHWIARATHLYGPMGAQAVGQPVQFRFPGGPRILTGHLKDQDSWAKYHGESVHKFAIDEINQIPLEETYLLLVANLRGSPDGIPQVFATGNPGNQGDFWVRKRWVEVYANGKRIPPKTPFRDPITLRTRIFIPAKVWDNQELLKIDPGYVKWLEGLPEAKKRAWLYGDFDAFEGQFFTEFRPNGPFQGEPDWARHVIHSSEYPLQPWWFRWIGMDWGYQHPSAIYWNAKGDDGRIYTYREVVASQMGSFELGVMIAKRSMNDLAGLPDGCMTLYLSHDAFSKEDNANTRAEQVRDGINAILGKGNAFVMHMNDDELQLRNRDRDRALMAFEARYTEEGERAAIRIQRANYSRIDGWDYMHECLRWRPAADSMEPDPEIIAELMKREQGEILANDYVRRLQASYRPGPEVLPKWRIFGDKCPALVQAIPRAMHDPNRPEDVLKCDGDDEIDAIRYSLIANKDFQHEMPRSYWLSMRMSQATERGITDPTVMAQVARHQESVYDRQHSGGGGLTFPRRGSQRHWSN